MGKTCAVFILDDHEVVRDGIAALLADSSEFRVVGGASTSENAISDLVNLNCQIILVDLSLVRGDGVSFLQTVKLELPDVKCLVFTMHADKRSVVSALEAGAHGYLLKSAGRSELMNALRTVQQGACYLHPQIAGIVVEELRTAHQKCDGLVPRELEILELIRKGHTNNEIAERLFLSVNTVKAHLKSLFAKLDVSDRTQAVMVAIERQYIPSQ